MIVTGTGGLSAVLKPCLGALLTIEAASGHGHKGWIWGCKFSREGRGVGLS